MSRTQLLYLSALGIWGLWGYAFFNGMFARLATVTRTHRFPDGRSLRSSYTGLAAVDAQLTLLSAFYNVLTNSLTSGLSSVLRRTSAGTSSQSSSSSSSSKRWTVASLILAGTVASAVHFCTVAGALLT
ncbi:hypothetical protein LY76DRAFT_598038 [Colletotrichum caudatum]|nr:hypothetical protein LY76DRAFT_598038 [Colletotrichum caudatum]